MSHTKHLIHATLGAISIFVIGVVVGVLIDRVVTRHSTVAMELHAQQSAVDAGHEGFLADLQNDLGLSADQASQVHEILNRHQEAVSDAWLAVHSRLEAAIDSVTSEIEQVLDADQRTALHEWLMQRHGLPVSHRVGEGH
jgi:hypothetical protein